MSLSSGSPGSILFWMPSRPAIIIAENARDGLHDGSGKRTSMRRAFGDVIPATGMRMEAERLRLEKERLTGASNPGTGRREVLVVGFVSAAGAFACFVMRPMSQRAMV